MSQPPQAPAGKRKNSGYLFENDRSNDRQPNFRGKVDVEGKEYWISIWEKPPREGKKNFSVELTDPATMPARTGAGAPAASSGAPSPRSSVAPAQAAAPSPGSTRGGASSGPSSSPPPPGEAQAFDDIFGGDGTQW